MRHFELMRFLFVTSFASKPDSRQSSAPALLPPTGVSRCNKLHSALPRTTPVATTEEENNNQQESRLFGRRRALVAIGGSFAFLSNHDNKANALDMDAFMSKELEADVKNCDPKRDPKCIPKLTADEALCKYGQSGNARGEACKRVKEGGGSLPQKSGGGKSLGGAYAM